MSLATKAAHTPGPWRIVPNGANFLSIQNDQGKEAVFVSKTRFDGYEEKDGWRREKRTTVESAEADALLISAAPQLLDGTNALLGLLQLLLSRDDMPGSIAAAINESHRVAEARAAVLKATGAEPELPACTNFQSDGRDCCRNCGHFHGPAERTPAEDAEDHLQNLQDRDRES